MTGNSMAFSNTRMQLDAANFLRELTEFMHNCIMEADINQRIKTECQ